MIWNARADCMNSVLLAYLVVCSRFLLTGTLRDAVELSSIEPFAY